ncbi:ribosome recycling factor [uncultured Ligilactobacillus sp.]|uniref:ribosome recycling factor n=5 Tax=uncultured Ligilactobacillus sp. TaxID=2837633 RepID=UPI00272B3A06|nr:ribosome recycling factor [uncultured Ligilactobacillus sp.]
MDERLKVYDDKMQKAYRYLEGDYQAIRAGRANPHVLDKVKVNYYGTPTPIQQVGNVTVPEPRMLQIAPWEKTLIKEIEKAIMASDVGITPSNEVAKYSLVEKFVDEDGKELTPNVTKGTDYQEGTDYDVTGDAKVIDGYYLKAVSDNAKGTFGKDNVTVTFTYAPLGKVIPVDPEGNPIPDVPNPQYPNDPQDPTKGGTTPVPEIPGMTPEVPSVTPENPGEDTKVVYNYDDQKATINYIDETTGQTLSSDSVTGKSSAKIDYSTAAKIKELTDKGYVLVSDGFPADATFDNDKNTDQVFDVILKHGEKPVGPNDPHEPGTPINPNDPDGPKWPAKDQYSKEYTSTVEFVDDKGNKIPNVPDDVQTSTWTRTLIVDTVTGEVKNPDEAWKADKDQYTAVPAVVVPGYFADKASVPAKDTVQENIKDQIVYTPLGKVVPVDPEGNPIPGADQPQYPNDPSDPTKGGTTPIPDVPGYHPQDPGKTTVTPDKPGENTPVVYVKDDVAKYYLAEKFVDEDGNEVAPSVMKGTDYQEGSDYDVTGDAKVIDGYYLKAVSDNAKGTFGKDDVTVTFTYAKLGKVVPVDPDGNPIPNVPNPQYPNDPTDPSKGGTTPVPEIPGYRPEVPSVTPDKPGEDTPVIYTPIAKYSLVEKFVDEEGNELVPSVTKGTDYEEGSEYDVTGDAKVIDGYYLKETSNTTGKFGKGDMTATFTYAKLGKVVPVDPDGNPIPNVPNPQYPNDPTDPSKGGTTPVPEIPGYRPEVPSVTPDKPGEDTPVKYVPVTPEKHDQTAKIIYVDTKTGKTIESDTVTGKAGSKIDYSTTPRIDELVKKGYVLVEDGFTNAGTPVYDDNDGEEQVFVVKLDHGTEPVGPNNPHEPGTPINPEDPNGPKWPAKDDYTKQYTSTVHFVDGDGNKLRDDDVQTSTWTRTLIVDKVTGEVLNPGQPWNSDIANYATVKVPVIEGYYADRAMVPGEATQQRDLETTVTYNKIGKIIPVDPNGNPIPNVPTPQYHNDPTDPTKVIVTEVPDIPGMIPETRSVTPGEPGVDTPVVYNVIEEPQTPEEPQVPQPEAPKTTPVNNETPAPKAEDKVTELPQTGDKQENTLAAVGATIMAGLLGLMGFTKKKDEKDF